MSATIAVCAESISPRKQLPAVPHTVHVRFDSFVLDCEPGQTLRFRVRVKPVATHELRTILQSFTPAIDPDSNHGFYLNFFGSALLRHDFPGTLRRLQLAILKHTSVNVSVGAAKSRVAAAVASRIANPGELRLVAVDAEPSFLAPLPIEVLHGMNGMDSRDLRNRGIATVAALQRVPRPALASTYGADLAAQIWCNSRGLDSITPLHPAATSGWSWLRLAAENLVAAL